MRVEGDVIITGYGIGFIFVFGVATALLLTDGEDRLGSRWGDIGIAFLCAVVWPISVPVLTWSVMRRERT